MVFNKQICMLIYVNQNNGEKMNCLKRNLNNKHININIKQQTRQKNPSLNPASIVNPKQVI